MLIRLSLNPRDAQVFQQGVVFLEGYKIKKISPSQYKGGIDNSLCTLMPESLMLLQPGTHQNHKQKVSRMV